MENPDVKNFLKNFRFIPNVRDLSVGGGAIKVSAIGRIRIPSAVAGNYTRIVSYLKEKILEVGGIEVFVVAGGCDSGGDVSNNLCIDMRVDESIDVCIDNGGSINNNSIDRNVNNNSINNNSIDKNVNNSSINNNCIDRNVNNNSINNNCIDRNVNYHDERYIIKVSTDGIVLTGASYCGLFRAAATFVQLLMNCPREIPCLEIRDWPDFPVRGFYHDVTRGRVPTLSTLKRLVDLLAFYKVNHLQLYVEHSFAFSKIPELWEGKDPLTAADIIELDKYCTDRYIDLVPSLSTFGHLYELLRLPRFEHLNELDIRASQTARCLWDRMAHYTLDVSNPESFELVKGMIEEYLPLFSSPYFNICCDETFDLGKGKNAARAEREGVGRLYVEFVCKVMGVVRAMGKKPMLWGDIVLKHPELISELPPDTLFLNWEYTPEVTAAPVKTFRDAGVAQYVCPGVQGWSRFAADVDRACANISRMARFGKDAGAIGLLNTDWGDCGHVNLLSNSYHGMAFGADLSWNVGDVVVDDVVNNNDAGDVNHTDHSDNFDGRFAFLQWGIGDDGYRLGKILRELGGLSAYHFGNLYAWINDKRCLWYKEDDVKAAAPKDLSRRAVRAFEIKRELETMMSKIINTTKSVVHGGIDTTNSVAYINTNIKQEFEEYVFAASATAWLLSILLVKKKYEYGQNVDDADIPSTPEELITGGNAVLEQFKTLWLSRSRESELRDVTDTFERVLQRVALWGGGDSGTKRHG
jgi:hypothetical protein